jgi:hypothetical protein
MLNQMKRIRKARGCDVFCIRFSVAGGVLLAVRGSADFFGGWGVDESGSRQGDGRRKKRSE